MKVEERSNFIKMIAKMALVGTFFTFFILGSTAQIIEIDDTNQEIQNRGDEYDKEITDPALFPDPEMEYEQTVPEKPEYNFPPLENEKHEESNGNFLPLMGKPTNGYDTSKPFYKPEPIHPTTKEPKLEQTTKNPCEGLSGIFNILHCGKYMAKKPSHATYKPLFGGINAILGGFKNAIEQNKGAVDKAVGSIKLAGEKVIDAGKDVIEAGWRIGQSLTSQHYKPKDSDNRNLQSIFFPQGWKNPDFFIKDRVDSITADGFKQDVAFDIFDQVDEDNF